MANFNERVYEIVKQIPKGMVLSYGAVAKLVEAPRCARFVGYALHVNPDGENIPCHRVVFKDGALCKGFIFGGEGEQKKRLKKEGVTFTKDGRVDMKKHSALL